MKNLLLRALESLLIVILFPVLFHVWLRWWAHERDVLDRRFVSEAVAKLTAEQSKVNPVSVYVPDLITKEQLDKVVAQYKEKLEQLRGLPEPSSGRSRYDHDDDLNDNED